MPRIKSIKEAEWLILHHLICVEDISEKVQDIYEIEDDQVQRGRFITASKNILKVLENMKAKRTQPEEF